MLNAALLLIVVGAVIWESIARFSQPHPVMASTVIWVATLGILVNGATAWLFVAGRKSDLNVRAAFVHMSADAAVSGGVVVAALLISVTGWFWLDPAVSLCIALLIAFSSWQLLRDATHLALDAVPRDIDITSVKRFLAQQPGIADVHHVHVWPISTTHVALTAHLVAPTGYPGDAQLAAMRERLLHDFRIDHATLQIETGSGCGDCSLP
jgi:cobalt-zinc-cadmium efflux system protein